MEYKLELKQFQKQDGISYKVLTMTDLSLHTSKKQPSNIGKVLKKAMQSLLPGRVYFPITNTEDLVSKEDFLKILTNNPNIISMIQEEERNGFKVLLELPKKIPILAGEDTLTFINSIKGKRILRMLDKKKETG